MTPKSSMPICTLTYTHTHSHTAHTVLVGMKKDLQVDGQISEDGRAMAERIGAYAYVECSAKLNEGVREVFETAARAAL